MRKSVIGLLLAASVAGCATSGSVRVPTIEEVQSATVSACSFLPTARTVASILAAVTGRDTALTGVEFASGIASAICTSISQPVVATESGGVVPPTVAGVVVRGKYIGK